MDDSTKALYDLFPEEDKSDFFSAYIYMKFHDHFIYHALQACSLPSKERTELPDAAIDEMLEASIQRVEGRDTAGFPENRPLFDYA
jgi:hypothetical protein